MEHEEKSGFEAAGTMENYDANIVQNFGTSKRGVENVTQDIFEATKGNKSRTPFMAAINGKAAKERGALDFPPKSEDLKEFPLWGLPQELQDAINDVANGYWCAPTIPAVAALAAVCAAIGKKAKAEIDNHLNYPTLWPVVIGVKSVGKTSPSYFFFKAFEKYDDEEEERYNDELAVWMKDKKQGPAPKYRQRIIQGVTDEAFLKQLADNNGEGCLYLDEFATMAGGWGRYAKNGNVQILGHLESIYSQVTTKVTTIGRGTFRIKNPACSLFATTQPRTYERIMKPLLLNDDGLFERFSPVFVSKRKGAKQKTIIKPETKQNWVRLVERLLHIDEIDLVERPEATAWREKAENHWLQMEEQALESTGQLAETEAALWHKATYTLYRVVIAIAVLRGDKTITAPSMRYAAEVTQFFVQQQQSAAIKLLDPEENTPNKTETMRNVFYHYPNAVISRLADALKLGESGRVWLTNIKNGRK